MTDPAVPPLPPLNATCEVLVVGAGPAGSACAQWLARAGMDVLLIDQQAFPRDKVCGDGLIPDAHRALRRLGLYDAVMAEAKMSPHLRCIGSRGGRLDVPGALAVLPRKRLDALLKDAAEAEGARFAAPARFLSTLIEGGRVVGARVRRGEKSGEVRARWTVLATGAVPKALIAAGVCRRQTPSGIALRGYVRHPALADRLRSLEVMWHRKLRRGYGWIFPAPDGVFNIGVGLSQSHRARADGRATMEDVNLRELMGTFAELHAPARELLEHGEMLGDLKGAPLRCSLDGAELSQPGLLVTGEAAGSTYAFTGEGIGKALETGLLAAEALIASRRAPADAAADAAVRERYEAAIAALKPRFALYERANRVNDHPWLADLLIWRARHSPGLVRRMSGVLDETDNPGRLVSLRGLAKLMLPIT